MKSEFGNVFSRLFRCGVKLTPFETCALQCCIDALPNEISDVIIEQLEQYNLVQREADWRALNFYLVRGFQSVSNVEPLLSLKHNDVPLIKVALVNSRGETINVVLHAVSGRMFSINFGISIKPFQNETNITKTKVIKSWLSAI
jgi:hypothetical protein